MPGKANINRIELILDVELGGQPVTLAGALDQGKLANLSGWLSTDLTLAEALRGLGEDFQQPAEQLSSLTGGAIDELAIKGLGLALQAQAPKSLRAGVALAVGDLDCRFDLIKLLGSAKPKSSGGVVVGAEIQGKAELPGNLLSGLIGDIEIEQLAVLYASEAVSGIDLRPLQDGSGQFQLTPGDPAKQPRDLLQGMNFALRLKLSGISLLDADDGAQDDTFSAPALPRASSPAPTPGQAAELPPSPIKWIETNKQIGPVGIRRIGLGYRKGEISLRLDAGLQLAVLAFTLEGMGLDVPLNKLGKLFSDPEALWRAISFHLDGASLSVNLGPVSITGGLILVEAPETRHDDNDKTPKLRLDGSLQVQVPMLTIGAIGSYATLPSGAPSFFAFAALHKELGGPAFFFVTGLCLGFGINRKLSLPPITKLHEFPLLRAAKDPDYLGKNLDLRKISEAISAYISPSQGDFWLAAGVKFTSFGMLETVAMLSVAFGNRFEVALLGLSSLQLPKPVPGTPLAPLAVAELAIKVVFAPEDGVLSVEGRLTEASFVLRKDFTLRGGFAFYSWFGGPHQGDFVVSLGGYHAKFKPPAHYPRPELVEFNCVLKPVTINGYCYFALCPVAVMAGGGLSVVFQTSGIRAWLVAHADFLVQWKPLYYDIGIGVSIGVRVSLSLVITRVTLNLELSAQLALNGPPLAGQARIDLEVVSFTIRFGEAGREPPPLSWEAIDDDNSFAKSFLTNPDVTRISISAGLNSQIDTDQGPIRLVDPHRLNLVCRSTVPANSLHFNGAELLSDVSVPDLGVRPMAKASMYSEIRVSLSPKGDDSEAAQAYLDQYIDTELITEGVPKALWGTEPLDRKSPPDGDKQMISGAPVGFSIRTKPGPRPWQSALIELETLAYDRYTRRFPDWRSVQSTQPLPGAAVRPLGEVLKDPNTQAHRRAILERLNRTRQILDPDAMALDDLATHATGIYQVMPTPARVGQEPPATYEDIKG